MRRKCSCITVIVVYDRSKWKSSFLAILLWEFEEARLRTDDDLGKQNNYRFVVPMNNIHTQGRDQHQTSCPPCRSCPHNPSKYSLELCCCVSHLGLSWVALGKTKEPVTKIYPLNIFHEALNLSSWKIHDFLFSLRSMDAEIYSVKEFQII